MSVDRTFVCSVVFLDIVGFSKQVVSQQIQWKHKLNEIIELAVKNVPINERVLLDTGDGASLCFLGDPETALTTATTIRESLSTLPTTPNEPVLRLRMGINMGSVKVVTDFNQQRNIVGDGINVGQRIMSFAGENQILASRSFYEVIACLNPHYQGLFVYGGKHADKHDREHEVYEIRTTCEVPKAPETLIVEPDPIEVSTQSAEDAPDDYSQEVLQQLQLLMIDALGPIAPVLIARAAKGERSLHSLCDALASQIPDQSSRIKFVHAVQEILALTANKNKVAIPDTKKAPLQCSPEKLTELSNLLTLSLGPIAKKLVNKRANQVESFVALIDLLATEISDLKDREKFRVAALNL